MSLQNAALLILVVAFLASHFLLAHPLRAPLIGLFGRSGFTVVYSLIALVLLIAMAVAYHAAPHDTARWSWDNVVLQVAFDAISYVSVALFIGSLINNPALVGADMVALSTRPPTGAFLITRHPMMFAIAIWSAAQILLIPSGRNLIGCSGMIVLALVGARLQDTKKLAQSRREWGMWVSRTRFWPNPRRFAALGVIWAYALPVWVLVTWVQVRTTFAQCGLWYFFPGMNY
jgi:uncharacterized membrane protein